MRIYLDNAATTPLHKEVIASMSHSMRELFGNPSSIHAEGRRVRAAIEEARKKVAKCLGASIGEVFFTSGGTESNNLALTGAVRDLGVERIISSPIEHPCVFNVLEHLKKKNVTVEWVELDGQGHVNYGHLEALLKSASQKTLVSLMHANNEIGTLSDMERISNLCREHSALYHSDTVQSIGYFPIDVSKTGINFLAGAAHKFYGPKGVGFIYINNDNLINPMIFGGSQERNMRPGTENVYGILGLAKALELAYEKMDDHRAYIENLRLYMKRKLIENFRDIQFNGDHEGDFHYKILSVSFPPSPKAELLVLNLDIAGICASGGSACSSGAEKASHVLEAVEADSRRKSIRFSFSHNNTKEEVDFVIEKLKTMVALKERVAV